MKSVLIVDDEQILLDTYALVCSTQYIADTALDAAAGLAKFEAGNSYAVVLSDMNMPRVSGAAFLAQVRARWPDTVRIMLTGNRDQATAVAALHQGNVFRFLNKPCSPDALLEAVAAGIRQYELQVAERELLEKTLNGSVQILSEMLAMAEPALMVRAQKLRERAASLARHLRLENAWEIEIAAMLRTIGSMTIPHEIVLKSRRGLALTASEQQMIQRIPEIGSTLVTRIPRLEGVARIILYQDKNFDGTGFPKDNIRGELIPMGARLLAIVAELLRLEAAGAAPGAALDALGSKTGRYDPKLLQALRAPEAPAGAADASGEPVLLADLRVGQTLAKDIVTVDGVMLVSSGYSITETLLQKLKNYAASTGLVEPLFIERRPIAA